MKRFVAMIGAVALVLAAVPAMADDAIYNGSDLWTTPANGKTFTDFSREPIPAGFFCAKSAPFTGRVAFKGVPLRTSEGALGRVDTIVQRLDDATFNKRGVASTRIQMRALLLESVAPIKTACGSFNVTARLDGTQPVTRMRIVRESENSGYFVSNLAVNVKLTFTPVSGKARERLEVSQKIRFNPNRVSWVERAAITGSKSLEKKGFMLVDTDGDLRPDTYLPGTSNFAAGWKLVQNKATLDYDQPVLFYDEAWHESPTHEHVPSGY
jgi:hypothetical protein